MRDKQLVKYSAFGSNAKGVNASAAINDYANNLIRDWLCKKIVATQKVDGTDIPVEIPILYTIRNRALLEELIAYTPEINVDSYVIIPLYHPVAQVRKDEQLMQYKRIWKYIN